MEKKKIIIDTDCGSDDAMAIAMALNDADYEVLFLTTVSGNVPMEQATTNVLTTIEHAGAYEPPVYKGCEKMLLRELEFAYEVHGKDGMGDSGLVPKRLTAAKENGVFKLLEALRNSAQGEIDIVALGPLTNLALAIRLDLEAMKKAGRIVIMGSAGLGAGNVTPAAEFNIWQDAEAAKIVVESGLEKIIFVGWDACGGDCMFQPQEVLQMRESGALGKFVVDCNQKILEMNRKRLGDDYLDMADPSAMAAALYPDCIERCEKYYCQVDVSAGPSYGAVLVDVQQVLGKEPNVYICSKLSAEKYKAYVYRTLHVN